MGSRTAILAVILVCFLLILAMVPWIISSCAPRPLLPAELREAPGSYETAVVLTQQAEIDWMRTATSIPNVFVIGTIKVTEEPGVGSPAAAPDTTPATSLALTPTNEVAQSISSVAVHTIVAASSPTATALRIVIPAEASPETPAATPEALPTEGSVASSGPALPSGLVNTEDVITEELLTEQMARDAEGSLSDLTIRLTPDGFDAISVVTVLPGVQWRIEAQGAFAVENYSLVVKVSSIQSDGLDVTERYRGQLESSANTSLYRLLPERYVQSYELGDGEIRVYSKVRP